MADTQNYFTGIGRRKSATARVKLVTGNGTMTVNGRDVTAYFSMDSHKQAYVRPFNVTSGSIAFDVEAKVEGGGLEGQLEAFVLGISRALLKVNPEFRMQLKPYGLLTRDPRMKESRKYGRAGKARKMKSSPKR